MECRALSSQDMTTALACRDQHIAVGQSDDNVHSHQMKTYHSLSSVKQGGFAELLQVVLLFRFVALARLKQIRLWRPTTGQNLFSIIKKPQALAVWFNDAGSI